MPMLGDRVIIICIHFGINIKLYAELHVVMKASSKKKEINLDDANLLVTYWLPVA